VAAGTAAAAVRSISLALVLAAGLLQGCATTLEAQVTSFHEERAQWKGKRFVIVPRDDQRDSLEFKAYADRVARALESKGLVAATPGSAELEVRLRYGSKEQRPLVYSAPTYGYGVFGPAWSWGAYPAGVYYGWYPYFPMTYGVIGTDYREYRNWRQELHVEIVAPASSSRLYEATAFTEGSSDALAAVMPALVEAMFHDFPGPNGQVRQVAVELRGPPAAAAPAAAPASPPGAAPAAAPGVAAPDAGQSSGNQSPSK
jgi:hypothetical protein